MSAPLCNTVPVIISHIAGSILVYATRRARTDQFGESGWIMVFLIMSGVSF
jgi:hypothetical protein